MGRPRPDFAGRWSLSARRAWIEMEIPNEQFVMPDSRSPQGERG